MNFFYLLAIALAIVSSVRCFDDDDDFFDPPSPTSKPFQASTTEVPIQQPTTTTTSKPNSTIQQPTTTTTSKPNSTIEFFGKTFKLKKIFQILNLYFCKNYSNKCDLKNIFLCKN